MRVSLRPSAAKRMSSRRFAPLLVGAAFATTVVLGAPLAPAFASEDGLTVSTDGTAYEPNNTLPVLQDMGRVVPGDTRTESLWVRNDAIMPGRLHVDVIDPSSDDQALASHVTLSVNGPSGMDSTPTTISTAMEVGTCTVLASDLVLQPGESAELRISAAVSPELDQRNGVHGTVAFRLRGVLEDASVPSAAVPGTACGADVPIPPVDPAKDLSTTGGPSMLGIGAIGLLAVTAGAGASFASVRASRRRKSQNPSPDQSTA